MSKRDGAPVARWVADRVREVAPAGLGHWAPAWDIVEAPSRRFLDVLDRWEGTGSEADKAATKEAAAAVVQAWREAARTWEAAGRPTEPWAPNPSPEPVEARR